MATHSTVQAATVDSKLFSGSTLDIVVFFMEHHENWILVCHRSELQTVFLEESTGMSYATVEPTERMTFV